jgi:hypothetical protein
MNDKGNFLVCQVSNWPNPSERGGGAAITGSGGKWLSKL